MDDRWSKLETGLALGVLAAGWGLGVTVPSALVGAAAWSVVVFAVLYGLGSIVRRAARIELGIGEQMALGGVAWIAATGPLIALGVCSRGPLLVLAALATLLAVVDLAKRPLLPRGRPDASALMLGGLLGLVLIVQLLSVVATRGNPFDDQVGYTALVKRLLDCGDLVEPFSFRRISAYGGQVSLLALAALRGDVESTDLLDRGIFQAVAILVLVDIARRRQLHVAVTAIIVVFVLSLWDMSINSAATWTGFALFLAAYAFASRDDIPVRRSLLLAFAACAAACTLRQNYLVPAGLFAALLLFARVRAESQGSSWAHALRAERRTILLSIGVAAVIVIPYMVAAWHSNRTFLYPLLLGTVSPDAPLRPTAGTFGEELAFFVATALQTEPLRIWWLLVPLLLLARDGRTLRPLPAFLIANVIGMAFLVHSFTLSDPGTLWRYAYGYMTPLAVVFLVEVSRHLPTTPAGPEHPVRLGAAATYLVWLAFLAQFVMTRTALVERFTSSTQNLRAAITLGSNKSADAQLYRDLQAAVPAGAKLAVQLDDPYLLDYSRNTIFNLDLPGFASPPPGLPSYLGPERWRAYFLGLGIRHIAYVDAEHSTYLYRRNAWIHRMFAEGEIWRFMGARMIDTADTLAALARTSNVLFARRGLVVIDLGERADVAPQAIDDAPEHVRRDRFVRRISEQELGNKAWQLTSRSNVVFRPDGLGPSGLQMAEGSMGARRVLDELASLWRAAGNSIAPFRWLADRTLVRVRGSGRQHYRLKVWTDVARLSSVPSLRLVIDGVEHGRGHADDAGYIEIAGEATCHGWCDLYLVLSTLSEYWVPPEIVRGAKLLEFEWDEVAP